MLSQNDRNVQDLGLKMNKPHSRRKQKYNYLEKKVAEIANVQEKRDIFHTAVIYYQIKPAGEA